MNRVNAMVGGALAIVLLVALVAVIAMRVPAPGTSDPHAVVHDADGKTYELPLSTDTELTVETSLGVNVVVVQDGAVYVREANCSNHDCMHQGAIGAPGTQIICLPHELWIEVVANGQSIGHMDLDAAAGGTVEELDVLAR